MIYHSACVQDFLSQFYGLQMGFLSTFQKRSEYINIYGLLCFVRLHCKVCAVDNVVLENRRNETLRYRKSILLVAQMAIKNRFSAGPKQELTCRTHPLLVVKCKIRYIHLHVEQSFIQPPFPFFYASPHTEMNRNRPLRHNQ